MGFLWIVAASLVLVGWVTHRHRLHRQLGRSSRPLSDREIRSIERTGSLERDDEPLDLDEIERAEDEFWSQSWDEPESW